MTRQAMNSAGSTKSELGLRPIFHQKEHRSKGQITVLAYQLVR